MGHRCQMPKNYRQGKFVSNWTKMGRTVVGHCAGIPKNNSGQFGTKWTKMKRTPYEWIVFERFLDAEKWQPGLVCHQMDKYRVSEGFWDTRAGLAPNEPNWDEHLTIGRFRGNPQKCPIKGRKITPWTPQPSERSASRAQDYALDAATPGKVRLKGVRLRPGRRPQNANK